MTKKRRLSKTRLQSESALPPYVSYRLRLKVPACRSRRWAVRSPGRTMANAVQASPPVGQMNHSRTPRTVTMQRYQSRSSSPRRTTNGARRSLILNPNVAEPGQHEMAVWVWRTTSEAEGSRQAFLRRWFRHSTEPDNDDAKNKGNDLGRKPRRKRDAEAAITRQEIPCHPHAGIPRCDFCGSSPYKCKCCYEDGTLVPTGCRTTCDVTTGHVSYEPNCNLCLRGWWNTAVSDPNRKADYASEDLACVVCGRRGIQVECTDCGKRACPGCIPRSISRCRNCNQYQCEECWSAHDDDHCPSRQWTEPESNRSAEQEAKIPRKERGIEDKEKKPVLDDWRENQEMLEQYWPDLDSKEAEAIVDGRQATSVARLAASHYKLGIAQNKATYEKNRKQRTTTADIDSKCSTPLERKPVKPPGTTELSGKNEHMGGVTQQRVDPLPARCGQVIARACLRCGDPITTTDTAPQCHWCSGLCCSFVCVLAHDNVCKSRPEGGKVDDICALSGCNRRRQYDRGCILDKCCKQCHLTSGAEHESWCDREIENSGHVFDVPEPDQRKIHTYSLWNDQRIRRGQRIALPLKQGTDLDETLEDGVKEMGRSDQENIREKDSLKEAFDALAENFDQMTRRQPDSRDAEGRTDQASRKKAVKERAKVAIDEQLFEDMANRLLPTYDGVPMLYEKPPDQFSDSEELEDAEILQKDPERHSDHVEDGEQEAEVGNSPRSTHVTWCQCVRCCPPRQVRSCRRYETASAGTGAACPSCPECERPCLGHYSRIGGTDLDWCSCSAEHEWLLEEDKIDQKDLTARQPHGRKRMSSCLHDQRDGQTQSKACVYSGDPLNEDESPRQCYWCRGSCCTVDCILQHTQECQARDEDRLRKKSLRQTSSK